MFVGLRYGAVIMEWSAALPTFLVTLREGVEAALVVGIVLACLSKAQARDLNSWVYAGVGGGAIASAGIGALFISGLQAVARSRSTYAPVLKPLLEAGFCLVAIAMLSWMLIWMTQQAKSLKGEIETAVKAAVKPEREDRERPKIWHNAGWGVFTLVFIAVLREGFETVVFITAQFEQGLAPVLGAIFGLLGAVAIGFLLFEWGVKIDLRRFFQIMGILLLAIVSGLVISALKNVNAAAAVLSSLDPQYSQICAAGAASCLLGPQVWDTTAFLPDDRFPGVVFKALFGYRSHLYLAQAIAYVLFLATAGTLYFQSLSNKTS
jgi:high-affinity iron transporter